MKLLKDIHIKSLLLSPRDCLDRDFTGNSFEYTTGIDALDQILGGFNAPDLIAIASIQPAIGSTLLRNIALSGNLSFTLKQPVLCCIGLQCGHSYVLDLIASIVMSDKNIGFFKKKDMPMKLDNLKRYVDVSAVLKDLPIYISNDIRSIDDLKYRMESIQQECGFYPVVAVDDLSQLEKFSGCDSAFQSAYIIDALKSLAENYQIPVLFTAKVSVSDRAIALSDLKEVIHSELLVDKITVIDYENQDDPFDLKASVLKNRNGGTGSFHYDFDYPESDFLLFS